METIKLEKEPTCSWHDRMQWQWVDDHFLLVVVQVVLSWDPFLAIPHWKREWKF